MRKFASNSETLMQLIEKEEGSINQVQNLPENEKEIKNAEESYHALIQNWSQKTAKLFWKMMRRFQNPHRTQFALKMKSKFSVSHMESRER